MSLALRTSLNHCLHIWNLENRIQKNILSLLNESSIRYNQENDIKMLVPVGTNIFRQMPLTSHLSQLQLIVNTRTYKHTTLCMRKRWLSE